MTLNYEQQPKMSPALNAQKDVRRWFKHAFNLMIAFDKDNVRNTSKNQYKVIKEFT